MGNLEAGEGSGRRERREGKGREGWERGGCYPDGSGMRKGEEEEGMPRLFMVYVYKGALFS